MSPIPESQPESDVGNEVKVRPEFADFVPLDTDISPKDALEFYHRYYPSTDIAAFERDFPELVNASGTVRFSRSTLARHAGEIQLSGKTADGKEWYCFVSAKGGHRRPRIS